MHVIDFWLEGLQVFYPSNLKSFLGGIAKQLGATFSFLFVTRWWLAIPLLFSHLAMYGLMSVTNSCEILYFARIIVFGAQVYFAFVAILVTFPFVHAKSPRYFTMRQGLFWPIVTPFVLWIYFSCHFYKLLALIISYSFLLQIIKYGTFALLVLIDWFASPLFVFFGFIIIDTYAQHGVLYALEHAFSLLLYSYPLCVIMFGCLYALQWALNYGTTLLGAIVPELELVVNPIAILIPVAAVLFGAVYQWYTELVE